MGEEHDDAEPQRVSERSKAVKQILSRKREHVPFLHVPVAPRPHRVGSHQS